MHVLLLHTDSAHAGKVCQSLAQPRRPAFQLSLAHSVKDAAVALSQSSVDVVLLDLTGRDALDLLEQCRAQISEIPIVVLTCDENENLIAMAVFSRNAISGELTFVEFERDGIGGVDGMECIRVEQHQSNVHPGWRHVG